MYQIFHGCAKGYSDGSKKDGKCITPISNCYWNNPNDIINCPENYDGLFKRKREMLKHI